jgi:hypothetical protein
MRLTQDPMLTFGKLFASVKKWPAHVPPGRPPSTDAPWTEADWDALLAWLNTPPDLPPLEDLL